MQIFKNKQFFAIQQRRKKTGLWVEIFSNFWQEAQVFEKGEYKNQNKQGLWSINYEGQLMEDIQSIIKLEAVVNIMNLERNKVIELSYMNPFADKYPKDIYRTCQVFYKGVYANGQRIGKWVTINKDQIMYYMKSIGQKIGL